MISAQVIATPYGRSGSTTLTAVNHAAEAANTFPAAFTVIAASTNVDASGLWLHCRGNSGNTPYQFKLFAGAAAAEVEFAHVIGPVNGGLEESHFYIPIPLPAGTRVTAKSASGTGFANALAGITLIRGTIGMGSQCSRGTVIGLNAGQMTEVDCGATANTKGAWAQLIASTARDAKGYTLVFASDLSLSVDPLHYLDIGVGAAASEVAMIEDWPSNFQGFRPAVRIIGPIWTPIPASSRIAARAQCSSNAVDTRVPLVSMILWE